MRNKLLAILVLSLLAACRSPAPVATIRAVYLVQQEGQLPHTELSQHPEILVTSSFADFQHAARSRVGLWIDKNAIGLGDSTWLDLPPQSSYPIIVIGYNDTLLSFRDSLR